MKLNYLHLPYVKYNGTEYMAEEIEAWTGGYLSKSDVPNEDTTYNLINNVASSASYLSNIVPGTTIIRTGDEKFIFHTFGEFNDMGHYRRAIVNDFRCLQTLNLPGNKLVLVLDVWDKEDKTKRTTMRVHLDSVDRVTLLSTEREYADFLTGVKKLGTYHGNETEVLDYLRRIKI
jgi:hypothetical protein